MPCLAFSTKVVSSEALAPSSSLGLAGGGAFGYVAMAPMPLAMSVRILYRVQQRLAAPYQRPTAPRSAPLRPAVLPHLCVLTSLAISRSMSFMKPAIFTLIFNSRLSCERERLLGSKVRLNLHRGATGSTK